jgi:hypothetical protein
MSQDEKRVKLDLSNEVFQENLLGLDKAESARVLNTLRKLRQMTWAQVYRDPGLKWEKIDSVEPPKGIDAIYSLRITQARRATAYREADFMPFLTVQPDHDSTYGKK